MENNGWIYLHKKMTKWEWYDKPFIKSVFLDFLLNASYEDKKWHGIVIKRGQLIIGRKELSKRLGISQQSIRTCIERLKSTNEITSKSTNKYTIITVVNYDKYQMTFDKSTNKSTKCLTNNQPTTNQQLTTSNKYNKDNKYNKEKKEKKEKNSSRERAITFKRNNNNSTVYSLSENDLKSISEKYSCPLAFVVSKYDDMINWHEKNPQKNHYKNYLSALRDWVKRDLLSINQKNYERNSKIAVVNTDES